MKRIGLFDTVFVAVFCSLSLSVMTGCGASCSVKQSLAETPLKTGIYGMGLCETQDTRATEETCDGLQDRIRYGLLKRNLYEKNESEAPRKVNLTITYFRNIGAFTRGNLGVMCGKDAIDVTITVIDKQSGTIVGSATAYHFNTLAIDYTEKMMINEVSKKIVDFLASGS